MNYLCPRLRQSKVGNVLDIQGGNIIEDEEDPRQFEDHPTPFYYDATSPAAVSYGHQNSVPIPYDDFTNNTQDKIYNRSRRPPEAQDMAHMLVHMYGATRTTDVPRDVALSHIDELINRGSVQQQFRNAAYSEYLGEVEVAIHQLNALKSRLRQDSQAPVRSRGGAIGREIKLYRNHNNPNELDKKSFRKQKYVFFMDKLDKDRYNYDHKATYILKNPNLVIIGEDDDDAGIAGEFSRKESLDALRKLKASNPKAQGVWLKFNDEVILWNFSNLKKVKS